MKTKYFVSTCGSAVWRLKNGTLTYVNRYINEPRRKDLVNNIEEIKKKMQLSYKQARSVYSGFVKN
jgi:hypothetical protein